MHLLTVHGKRLLLDCGLFQGPRAETFERNRNFPFDPATIHAVILSHAHIDHAGNLPNLVRRGFRGTIYSTPATRDLCTIMLYDSAHLNERDVEFVNKKHLKRHEPPVEPLYTVGDVEATMNHFAPVNYRRPQELFDGLVLTLFDAGHILGSAVVVLELEEGGRSIRLGFTGDLGRSRMPILKDPEPMGDVDLLISESTYGGRVHEPLVGMKESLLAVIRRTTERGGRVIIPSFSVGRTQELVYLLFQLCDEGKLPALPVYVDSPLAVNATDVFRKHPECFDEETLSYLRDQEDPFGFGRLHYVRSVEESKALNDKRGPCVIIAASGMCEGGRILHHLAHSIEESRNTILIVGYQAEHTLGRRLVEQAPEVKIFGDLYKRRAEVVVLNSFSAHAGQDELLAYVGAMDKRRLKDIFLVHGELAQAEKLRGKLDECGYARVAIPQRGEKVEF
jgi:metallo-beta-lactamase family protein